MWYDVDASTVTSQDGTKMTVVADLDKFPLYQQEGAIIPRQLGLRRSA
jgi:hypothetical protein